MTDIIQAVRQFTEAVGCTTDRFNVRQTALYIGLQLEEMAEKLEALDIDACAHDENLIQALGYLQHASQDFKNGILDSAVRNADRAAMLDADVDLAWVTIGSALSQGADVEGAAGEVARANLSKLEECCHCGGTGEISGEYPGMPCPACGGTGLVAIKDENGKVKKPEGWTPPNIEPFVCKAKGGAA